MADPQVLRTYDIHEDPYENLIVREATRYGAGKSETLIEFRDMAAGDDEPAWFSLSPKDAIGMALAIIARVSRKEAA